MRLLTFVGDYPTLVPSEVRIGTRRRVVVVVVAGLLGTIGAAFPARACPPEAHVQGQAEIVDPVVAILRGHGVGTASSACGARIVKASLVAHAGGEGYRLHVLDAAGHSSDRQVADAATAASLIESWALDEDAELLAPRPAPGAAEGAAVSPPVVTERGDAPIIAHTLPQIGAMAETSISPDAALWWGAGASACARLGTFCLGGRADVARAETTLEIDRARGIAPDLTRTLAGVSVTRFAT